MAKGDDLQERLIDFAVAIIAFCAALPKTQTGNHVAGQIMQSGTSPAPNYGEARGAESRRDFVHKLKVVMKELNETGVWLRIIRRSKMFPSACVAPIEQECDKLCKIISTSIKTVLSNSSDKKSRRARTSTPDD